MGEGARGPDPPPQWGMEPRGIAGKSLFYGIDTEARRLHVVRLDLTRNRIVGPPTPLEPQMRQSSYPGWSPDGQKLLYFVGRASDARLMLRSTVEREARDVTPASLAVGRDLFWWGEGGRRVLIYGTERESGV